ncbi:MAG: NifU family protein [Bdellovibrionales bacterium]|nr:NifU family protein [Bdellovibrionales bacterium]
MSLESKDILVRVMETPNPLAIKLVVNFPLKNEGKVSVTEKKQVDNFPLLEELFGIAGVYQLHIFENQVSLSHDGKLSFDEISKQAEQVIKKWGDKHDPSFQLEEEKVKKKKRDNLSEEECKIEEILDRTIRPGLQADGGDLEVVSFKGNKVEISYQGACGGCPSSYMETLFTIENILRYELGNDKIEVYPI